MLESEAKAALFAIIDGIPHPKCTQGDVDATFDKLCSKGHSVDHAFTKLKPQYVAIKRAIQGRRP